LHCAGVGDGVGAAAGFAISLSGWLGLGVTTGSDGWSSDATGALLLRARESTAFGSGGLSAGMVPDCPNTDDAVIRSSMIAAALRRRLLDLNVPAIISFLLFQREG